ncbi:hypothetical protein K144313037_22880 [Clostridium tetani]|uniref:ATP-cone domain-containing protein n=1 Tax=Clostridium tetani TaxID=1513 RepID=A0A4V1LEL3_CLOTA|nr:ATP cone domain-containing protein [Clostridium tetani]RXI48206.1 hypothetical protein DP130_08935 [Clostridium tetani]BDR68262.1 hypothetical protein K144312032_24900 [Clostridium tetani]BDR70876.1 hypothetical protein K144313037_22880 [Clostridium tetani]BDR73821.1 hypothetical protein K144316041_25290 [Clostridium tetani]BDR82193.1 hypothetical protein K234311028_24390 [Clostridium tetani]
MYILKKDGTKEKFDTSKLKNSIINASNEINVNLNESDLNLLIKCIINVLLSINEEIISSYAVFGVTTDCLKKNGFKEVAKKYVNYCVLL